MSFFRGARKSRWLRSQCMWIAGEGWGNLRDIKIRGEHDRSLGGKEEECTIQTPPFHYHCRRIRSELHCSVNTGKGRQYVREKECKKLMGRGWQSFLSAKAFHLKAWERLVYAQFIEHTHCTKNHKTKYSFSWLPVTDLTSQQML